MVFLDLQTGEAKGLILGAAPSKSAGVFSLKAHHPFGKNTLNHSNSVQKAKFSDTTLWRRQLSWAKILNPQSFIVKVPKSKCGLLSKELTWGMEVCRSNLFLSHRQTHNNDSNPHILFLALEKSKKKKKSVRMNLQGYNFVRVSLPCKHSPGVNQYKHDGFHRKSLWHLTYL